MCFQDCSNTSLVSGYRLVGLVVKASASRAEDRGLIPACPHGLAFTRRGCFLTKLAHSFLTHLCLSFCLPESFTCTSFHPSTYLQFSSSDCPFCLHRPFTYISLLYKPSFCHFSFSHTLSVPRSRKMLAFWAGRKSCIYAR